MPDNARLCDNPLAAEPKSGLGGLYFAVMESGTPATTDREAGRDIDAPLATKPTPKRTPWNRKNPYQATVLTNRVQSGPGS